MFLIFCCFRSVVIAFFGRTKSWRSLGVFWRRNNKLLVACSLVAVSVLPASVAAQDWSLFSTQDRLGYEETKSLLIGKTLKFQGLGQSTYHSSGAYTFTYENQNITKFGYFEVRRDGRVCLDVQDQSSGCSIFVKRNGLLFLLTPEGRRFQVTLEFVAN